MVVFRISLLFILYFTEIPRSVGADDAEVKEGEPLGQPTDWFKTREMWRAKNYNYTNKSNVSEPLRLVIIHDTDSQRCHRFILCASEMRLLQSYYHSNFQYDIPYNFLIGGDGRVYEGRGWNVAGAHTNGYNRCSLGLAFIGDYRDDWPCCTVVTELQQQRAQLLLEEGVKLGHLSPNFHVLGAKDLRNPRGPGTNLYRAIKGWSNYDHENLYKNLTCEEIEQL
ncbi:unnamed protein product [Arctia plantaginis]|uniref:Peptidoglycan-recognition protein n=1 Tax=Arctia plantaginis TaxID=874455 RepID=A0A8S1AJU7_ARCPL|nr:unnamed protein product [Arctia plantaginis]